MTHYCALLMLALAAGVGLSSVAMADISGNDTALYFTAAMVLVSASLFGMFAPETGKARAMAK